MPREYLSCVASEVKSGKPRAAAQRMCAIAYWKRHGATPQQAAKESQDMSKVKTRVAAQLRAARERGDEGTAQDLRALLESTTSIQEAEKTENGQQFPKAAYAYTPSNSPGSWKLRLWENPTKKVTIAQLGRAAAAFSSGGFRGEKVNLPDDAVAGVKAKIRAEYRKLGTKPDDMPKGVKEQLIAEGVLAVYGGGALQEVYCPTDESITEAYVTISGSYEATIRELQAAVKADPAKFGGSVDNPWNFSIEATFPGRVVVSGPESELYRANWTRDDAGAITFDNVQTVAAQLVAADGAKIPTVQPAPAQANTAVSTSDGGAFLQGAPLGESELLETYIVPLRVLTEKTSDNGDHLMTVECVLGVAEQPTSNGRVYPKGLFEKLVAESVQGTERSKRWLGEGDHPAEGRPRLMSTVTKPWRNLRMDGNQLLGETDVLPTSLGQDLQVLVRNDVPVQVSSRAFAKTTTEVKDGQTIERVDETSALAHWGGWDFVLGAAAEGAGVVSYSERSGQPAATASPDAQEAPGDSIDEVLDAMELKDLLAQIQETVTATMTSGLKPLLETKEAEDDAASAATAAVGNGETKTVTESDVLARVDALTRSVNSILENQTAEKAEKSEAALAVAMTSARKAIMENDEISKWSPPARTLLEHNLGEVAKIEGLAPMVEKTQKLLVETGLLVINGAPTGLGFTAAHVSSTAEKSKEDRAKEFQQGGLADRFLPETKEEAFDLLCEGIPDNGMRSSNDPDDPIRKAVGDGNLPFPGYHPGNPRHQFRQVLETTVRSDSRYLMSNLRSTRPGFRNLMEWTGVANVAQSVPFVLPTIRQVWMRLIAMDLMSVQPMSKSTGLVHYLNFVYDPGAGDPAIPGQFISDYGNYISEQAAIPEVSLTLTHADVTTDTKKLKAEWSTEVAQNLRMDHGLDIASEMINFMADEIAREVNAELLNTLRTGADPLGNVSAGNVNWGCTMPAAGYTNQTEWNRELYTAILRADTLVRAQRRARTNWMVCGANALVRLMRLEHWTASAYDEAAADWNVGISRVGTLDGNPSYKVYSADADIWPTDFIMVGRKGSAWPDAGMVYCPMIPFYTSGLFIDPNTFCQREAVMSRFGYLKVVGNAYASVTTQPGVQGLDWI